MALVSISCPTCNHPGHIPDIHLGKKVRCKKCGVQFVSAQMTEPDPQADFSPPPESSLVGDTVQFVCLCCKDEYAVAASREGKVILCRTCSEPGRAGVSDVVADSNELLDPLIDRKGGYSRRSIIGFTVALIGAAVVFVLFNYLEGSGTIANYEKSKKSEEQRQIDKFKEQIAELEAERLKSVAERDRIASERERLEQENNRRERLGIEAERLEQARKAEEVNRLAEQKRINDERLVEAIERKKREVVEKIKEGDKKGRQAMLEYSLKPSNSPGVVLALAKVGRLVELYNNDQFNSQSIEKSLGYVSPADLDEMRFIMKRLGASVVVNLSDPPEKWISMSSLFEKYLKVSLFGG